jgi:hypothetical protein
MPEIKEKEQPALKMKRTEGNKTFRKRFLNIYQYKR